MLDLGLNRLCKCTDLPLPMLLGKRFITQSKQSYIYDYYFDDILSSMLYKNGK